MGVDNTVEWAEGFFVANEAFLVSVARAAVAFLLVYAVGRWLVTPAVVRVVRARNRRNPTLVTAVERYVRMFLAVLALLGAVVAAGFGNVLTASSVVIAAATLAVGVAGQDVIGNLVSGMFLVSDPDFSVDEWITWPGGEGIVETIRFRTTRVRTADGQVTTVPNTELATSAVTRPYGRHRHRTTVELVVAFEDDVDTVFEVLRELADELPAVRSAPAPKAYATEFGDNGVVVHADFWIDDPTPREVKEVRSAYIERVDRELAARGVTISPPDARDLSGTVAVSDAERGGPPTDSPDERPPDDDR